MKLVFCVNEARFLVSHRLPLVREAQRRGFAVLALCGENTGEAELDALGVPVRTVPMSRSGLNPRAEIKTLRALTQAYRDERPDIAHHVTIKPVIYGTRAAKKCGVPAVVNAVPGMGFVFTRRGALAALRRMGVNLLYKDAFSHPNMRVIFQNSEDLRGFVTHGLLQREQTVLIRGSGIDPAQFCHRDEPEGPATFLLVARMLRDKGVFEFAEAAQCVHAQRPDWRFLLVGDPDPGNPSSLTPEELCEINRHGAVRWLGARSDVAELMAKAHVVCLPSYREGLPKTLLEASACGRPMIASEVAGCREVVHPEVNGVLVPPRDAQALAQAMLRLGDDPALRQRFGAAARAKAEAVFGIDDVVRHTFMVYDALRSA